MKNYPLIELRNFPKAITETHSKDELLKIIEKRNTTDSYLSLGFGGRLIVIMRKSRK